MSSKIGINQWSQQRIISGCRVAFDPRTTEQVCTTRSDRNGVAAEHIFRKIAWEERRAAERSGKHE